eukprot:193107-Rhodomonas_salina.1
MIHTTWYGYVVPGYAQYHTVSPAEHTRREIRDVTEGDRGRDQNMGNGDWGRGQQHCREIGDVTNTLHDPLLLEFGYTHSALSTLGGAQGDTGRDQPTRDVTWAILYGGKGRDLDHLVEHDHLLLEFGDACDAFVRSLVELLVQVVQHLLPAYYGSVLHVAAQYCMLRL